MIGDQLLLQKISLEEAVRRLEDQLREVEAENAILREGILHRLGRSKDRDAFQKAVELVTKAPPLGRLFSDLEARRDG